MNDTGSPETAGRGTATEYRSGLVALVGRPNVGKSTLLNQLLGYKISITSPRPQTTRHRILGIHTTEGAQTVYVDTPGVHKGRGKALNRALNRTALDSLQQVDLAVMVAQALAWTREDEQVLRHVLAAGRPVILAVNKVDRVRPRTRLLPYLKAVSERADFAAIVPLSALKGENLQALEAEVRARLPVGPPLFEPDRITDRSQRFLAAERIREKLFRRLGQELPYGLTVEIERFEELPRLIRLHALIWVEKPSHKPIVIGHRGRVLKAVGTEARRELEALFGKRIHMELWVKVREGWSDDERALRQLGIGE
ncbi:MAG: GTPase Era [Gammaproteobacteria bacterium]|nr:MAG: GTPase Era [Gammaproteobacteria bacterium]